MLLQRLSTHAAAASTCTLSRASGLSLSCPAVRSPGAAAAAASFCSPNAASRRALTQSAAALSARRMPSDAVAVYLHWPFCSSICTYCDFVKTKAPPSFLPSATGVRSDDEAAFASRLARAAQTALLRADRSKVGTLYFGGGTPSVAAPESIAGLVKAIEPMEGAEVTLECNPTSVEVERFKEFKNAGITRVSIGVQSLDSAQLELLGRKHTGEDGIRAVEQASAIFGPDNVSFDLMYGLPGQTIASWRNELERMLSMGTGHLSLYELTLKHNTKLAKLVRAGKLVHEPDPEMYFTARDVAKAHGLRQYEVSNFARPGCESEHNLAYWRCNDFIGVGPGATGIYHVDGRWLVAEQEPNIDAWARAVDANGLGVGYEQERNARTAMLDNLGALLRIREGICLPRWEREFGHSLTPLLHRDPSLRSLLRTGVLQLQPCPIEHCSCVTGGDTAAGLTCSAGIDDDAVTTPRSAEQTKAATEAATAVASPPEAFPGAASAPSSVQRLVTTSRSLALADGILQCFAQAMRADGLLEATDASEGGAPNANAQLGNKARPPGAAARGA